MPPWGAPVNIPLIGDEPVFRTTVRLVPAVGSKFKLNERMPSAVYSFAVTAGLEGELSVAVKEAKAGEGARTPMAIKVKERPVTIFLVAGFIAKSG